MAKNFDKFRFGKLFFLRIKGYKGFEVLISPKSSVYYKATFIALPPTFTITTLPCCMLVWMVAVLSLSVRFGIFSMLSQLYSPLYSINTHKKSTQK